VSIGSAICCHFVFQDIILTVRARVVISVGAPICLITSGVKVHRQFVDSFASSLASTAVVEVPVELPGLGISRVEGLRVRAFLTVVDNVDDVAGNVWLGEVLEGAIFEGNWARNLIIWSATDRRGSGRWRGR
jgi:hypothetical protein